MQSIYQSHSWLPAQCKWLERLAKQLVHEVTIDRVFVNNFFAEHAGAKQLDKALKNRLDEVLVALNDGL